MAIIDQYDKRSGVTYVYESKSVWVPELKQSRSKRTLIGRRDPKTGEVVPTHKRKAKDSSNANSRNDDYYEKINSLLSRQRETTEQLNKAVKELDKINSDLDKLLRSK